MAPWAVLAVAMAAAGAWIMTQPMAMRGMMMPGMDMPMDVPMDLSGQEEPRVDVPGLEVRTGLDARAAPVPAGVRRAVPTAESGGPRAGAGRGPGRTAGAGDG